MQGISTKPYLLRALYEWCTDSGYTPHIAVKVDATTRVPHQFVRDGEIVLNISFQATSQLQIGNDQIEFSARFSGKSYKIEVPVANVLTIYARENGQGMAFPIEPVTEIPSGANVESTLLDEEADAALDTEHRASGLRSVTLPDSSLARTEEMLRSSEDAPKNEGGSVKSGKNHLKIVK